MTVSMKNYESLFNKQNIIIISSGGMIYLSSYYLVCLIMF